ncbi:hypothetical protein KIW84_062483 [Lathyrus oleraceus]|uniref:RRM domain-containing protein n=1 Tax=Pisum sativum TaxID=3888 RepID=A0A9D5A8E5_PEA|nr:hypothetical protein KIW84_062483 [Pisum sativum]
MNFILPTSLPNPDPGFNVIVTKEEFNLFHSIDRQLFSRLVMELGRETSESINVMAFIMWVERKTKDYNLVLKILQRWPDLMVRNLADEIVVLLNCIENSEYPNASASESKLLLIQHILRHNVTLEYFYEKRLDVITEVTKFINDVCVRAFSDIIEQAYYERAVKEQELYLANVYADTDPQIQPQIMYYAPPNAVQMVPQQVVPQPQYNEFRSTNNNNGQDINEILSNLNLDDIYSADTGIVAPHENLNKPIDARTLFITFSKGYPISEIELREFFTRKCGDIIDRLIMQEANPGEQPLYARLVVRPEAINVIDHFLEYQPRMKFAINGKHVSNLYVAIPTNYFSGCRFVMTFTYGSRITVIGTAIWSYLRGQCFPPDTLTLPA